MSWVPSGKTFSVNGCHYGKVGNFLGGKIKFGGISVGGLTAEASVRHLLTVDRGFGGFGILIICSNKTGRLKSILKRFYFVKELIINR